MEPHRSLIQIAPGSLNMVKIGQRANWTRQVKLVQEASKERVISKADDAIIQNAMQS